MTLELAVLLLLLQVEVELQTTALLSSKQFRLKNIEPSGISFDSFFIAFARPIARFLKTHHLIMHLVALVMICAHPNVIFHTFL